MAESAMSSTQPTPHSPSAAKSKKAKKKKSIAKEKSNGEELKTNGVSHDDHDEDEDAEVKAGNEEILPINVSKEAIDRQDSLKQHADGDNHATGMEDSSSKAPEEDTRARLDALVKEREDLRSEVASLRRSLELFQSQKGGSDGLQEELEEARKEKEQAENNYQKLLGRVNAIKQQLGDRLKADAEELSQARSRIEELEELNSNLNSENKVRADEISKLADEGEETSKELTGMRSRLNLSQQNWVKEREELLQRETYAKEEFESAKQAMQDWEILAMDERSIRENLADKVSELEEQVENHREAHERLEAERQSQSLTVDGLQRALKELQDARKKELREVVENSQSQIGELRKQLETMEAKASDASNLYAVAQKELERLRPFEVEVKEKNLIIGKQRHEAVILNEHLTKAFSKLKKGKSEDVIDRQLVTNNFLHFLSIDRSDSRKFQVLQIIASMLGWTDEQREQAGLARPGASNVNLRTPISSWHRTPSTPSLSSELFTESAGQRSESLGGLFSEFLERESEDGRKDSRSTSVSGSTRR